MIRHLMWSLSFFLLIGTASLQVTGEEGSPPAGYSLTGRVVDPLGNGMPGVNVWIIPGTPGGTSLLNATTNATGHYLFDLPPGNYTIVAALPGYSFTSSTAQVTAGVSSLAQAITGYLAAGMSAGTVGYPTGTVPSVFHQYSPAPVQYAPGVTGWAGVGGVGTGWVQGRVVDQSGIGIPSATLMVDGFQGSGATDEQGNYRLALSPGMHRIEAMRSGYGIPPRVVFVNAGQTTYFDLIGKRTVALGSRL